MPGLFGALSPVYVGAGQQDGRGGGRVLGIFPGTPKYEEPAPALASAAPDGKAIQVRIVLPGVLTVECALTPEVIASLASLAALVARGLVDSACERTQTGKEAEPEPSGERERPETEARIWERE